MAADRSPLWGALRWLTVAAGLLAFWQAVVWVTGAPRYILPPPAAVARVWVAESGRLAEHGLVTLTEILAGLLIGVVLGAATALAIGHTRTARRWLLPVVVASQAIPVFALAPVLVLWLGYGMGSKIAMATLIIFFPVCAAFLDGIRRTEPGWVDLARTMTSTPANAPDGSREGGDGLAILRHVRVPAALPALASGIRVATAVAPIGAIVGEWVGSSAGLGYLMLHANARMQIDLMFAALLTLAVFSVVLWFTMDAALRRLLPWQPDRLPFD